MKQPSVTSHNGPQLYSLIHKGIRSRLFSFTTSAGKVDFSDAGQLNEFDKDLRKLVESIRLHHNIEEKFIHPLISDRLPGGAEKLEEEHKLVDQQMSQILDYLVGIQAKTGGFERNRDLGLEFYLSFNRFLSFFLIHIDDEEERIQRILFDLCKVEELASTFGRILASQKPEELAENLKMVLSGANIDDLTGLFAGSKLLMTPEGYKNSVKLAESVLNPEVFSLLKRRAGID